MGEDSTCWCCGRNSKDVFKEIKKRGLLTEGWKDLSEKDMMEKIVFWDENALSEKQQGYLSVWEESETYEELKSNYFNVCFMCQRLV